MNTTAAVQQFDIEVRATDTASPVFEAALERARLAVRSTEQIAAEAEERIAATTAKVDAQMAAQAAASEEARMAAIGARIDEEYRLERMLAAAKAETAAQADILSEALAAEAEAHARNGAAAAEETSFIQSLNQQFGRGSDFTLIARTLAGGGALIGVGLLAREMARVGQEASNAVDQFREGKITVGEMDEELLGAIPLFGEIWKSGRDIQEVFTGDKEALKLANEEATRLDETLEHTKSIYKEGDKEILSLHEQAIHAEAEARIAALGGYEKKVAEVAEADRQRIARQAEERANALKLTDQNKEDIAVNQAALDAANKKITDAQSRIEAAKKSYIDLFGNTKGVEFDQGFITANNDLTDAKAKAALAQSAINDVKKARATEGAKEIVEINRIAAADNKTAQENEARDTSDHYNHLIEIAKKGWEKILAQGTELWHKMVEQNEKEFDVRRTAHDELERAEREHQDRMRHIAAEGEEARLRAMGDLAGEERVRKQEEHAQQASDAQRALQDQLHRIDQMSGLTDAERAAAKKGATAESAQEVAALGNIPDAEIVMAKPHKAEREELHESQFLTGQAQASAERDRQLQAAQSTERHAAEVARGVADIKGLFEKFNGLVQVIASSLHIDGHPIRP